MQIINVVSTALEPVSYTHLLEVRRFQEETENPSHAVKAVLLLDNAPAHPNAEKLVSNDGKIKCVFLPPNTTSILQPMDQGVIVACKRQYKKKFLEEVVVVLEDEQDHENDTRGARTLQTLCAYNIKSTTVSYTHLDVYKRQRSDQ